MEQHSDLEDRIVAVVALGNPGEQYERTRHNAGFQVLDRFARNHGVFTHERGFLASWGAGVIAGRKILFIKPLTFMNRSGEAVRGILDHYGIPAARMLVIHDDLDLPCGRVRLVQRGGAGGHRGVSSLMEHLGSQAFPRLKLGIGRPAHGEPIELFVLQPPGAEETGVFEDMIAHGAEVVEVVLSLGIATAMNRFNRRESPASGLASEPNSKAS